MGVTTIEWTSTPRPDGTMAPGYTWNPWRGCQHASLADGSSHPGCTNCYAEAMSKRNPGSLGTWGADGVRVVGAPLYWDLPKKWNSQAQAAGERRRVFCASLADVFEDFTGWVLDHEGNCVAACERCGLGAFGPGPNPPHCATCKSGAVRLATLDDLRRRVFRTIDETPWLDWLLLTKRPQNILRMWPNRTLCQAPHPAGGLIETIGRPNVWLGTSVSDQATADVLVPALLRCRDLASVLFLSCEPLLAPLALHHWLGAGCHNCTGCTDPRSEGTHQMHTIQHPDAGCDWVICGAESGHGARSMHLDWVRSLRDQCTAAGVKFFYKQDARKGVKIPTPELDGRRWFEFPNLARAGA